MWLGFLRHITTDTFIISLQATQMAKIRYFEAFDAASYVADVLRRTKEKPIPRVWKGKRLPKFLIKQLMEEEKKKKQQ